MYITLISFNQLYFILCNKQIYFLLLLLTLRPKVTKYQVADTKARERKSSIQAYIGILGHQCITDRLYLFLIDLNTESLKILLTAFNKHKSNFFVLFISSLGKDQIKILKVNDIANHKVLSQPSRHVSQYIFLTFP